MPKKNAKHVLPDPLPNGEILTDITKKKWCLGPSIGKGGFGEIYSAAEYTEGSKKNLNYQYVVKIEPHGNGPLFCEMHFFMRNAKPDMIKSWCNEKKISTLGIPCYYGSGSHEHGGNKYRFLVMDKYGKDLWHIFLENKKIFPVHTVFRIGLQLLESLEYIHNNGYVHADLKGANILLGLTKQTQNQVYLVDFGLASKYSQKDFKPDPKKAHNGTIEYTSRDAHDGVPTRRGDIEILAYNLVQWMGCVLPWEKKLSDPVVVQNSKIKYMNDINSFLNTCFGKNKIPSALKEFLDYVAKMSHNTEPDYKKLNTILTKGVKTAGGTLSGPLEFKLSTKHKNEDSDETETPEKKQKLTPSRRTPRSKLTNGNTSEVKIKLSRNVKKDTEEIESEEETPVKKPIKKKGKKYEELSDSENELEEEIPVKKTVKGRKKNTNEDDSVNSNGFNAEMLRIKRQIEEKKAIKIKRTRGKTNGSTSSGSGVNTPIKTLTEDDVIEATPPEILNSARKIKSATPRSKVASDLTPTRLRQRT